MTTLNLTNAEVSFLKDCLNEYQTDLLVRIKDLSELISFCETLNNDCVAKLKKDGEKLSNDLVLCNAIYFDLTTIY